MFIAVGTTQNEKAEHAPQPPHASRPPPVLQRVHSSSICGSRASTVQCDEILSNGEFAPYCGVRTGNAEDARPYEHVRDRPVNSVRVCESDKPRKPNITDQNPDLYTLIKSVVREQLQGAKPAQWKRFDGVIVYDKRDYDQAIICKRRMENIMSQSDVKDLVRIELYDNEQFLQSSVRDVDDVISKSSVIFVLLSVHSDTRQMNFFCEEAVARLHIDPSNQSPFGAASAFDTPLKCIIKPLQTAPSSRRMYLIPPGLMSVTSIDIFDFASSFTRDKIISTLREAINTRIRQEERDNTKREVSYMHRLTTGPQAPPQYSSHPLYNPALNGDMHSNGGVRKSTNGTTVFVKPSSGHHQQTVSTLREAINTRIRQAERDNTKREFSNMHRLTTGFQAPPLYSNCPVDYPALNGDMHSNGGARKGANGTSDFVKPSLGNHEAINEERRSQGGIANRSSTFILPLSTSDHHHQVFNGDKQSNGGVVNGRTAFIRPPSDNYHPQIPETFYAPQMPYVQERLPPASPESEPNPMDLLPSYFAERAPNPVSHPQYGVLISEKCHQNLSKQTLSIPMQRPVQETQSPGDLHGNSPITNIQITRTNRRKANDINSSQCIRVQQNAKPEEMTYGYGNITDNGFNTDALHYTHATANMLGCQNATLINRQQYNPPYEERNGMSISVSVSV